MQTFTFKELVERTLIGDEVFVLYPEALDEIQTRNERRTELERSHASTVAALKAELSQAQQAIQRMTVEAKTADQRLSVAKDRIAELETALRFYAEARDFYLTDKDGKYHDDAAEIARSVMEPGEVK